MPHLPMVAPHFLYCGFSEPFELRGCCRQRARPRHLVLRSLFLGQGWLCKEAWWVEGRSGEREPAGLLPQQKGMRRGFPLTVVAWRGGVNGGVWLAPRPSGKVRLDSPQTGD